MAIKKATFIPKGMQRDNSASVFNADYAYENKNIRIIAGEDNNSFSITNEKGNQELYLLDKDGNEMIIEGTVIGYAVISNYLILFTTTCDIDEDDVIIMPLGESSPTYDPNTADRIYKFYIEKLEIIPLSGYTQDAYNAYGELLYVGNLNFRYYKPIETLPIYENEDILKVYWTDGFNQPRMINVAASEEARALWSDDYFNFIRELSYNDTFSVTKHYSGGYFQPGTIQYTYAYYTKYGQITNLVNVTPLYYISFVDRGGKADETTSNSFEITLENPDKNFEYVRIFSIQRTSLDAAPIVKKVVDLPINSNTTKLNYIDTGMLGETIDPTELYYIGGEQITAETFTSKDNVLFLGNINIKRDRLSDDDHLKEIIHNLNITEYEDLGSTEGDLGEVGDNIKFIDIANSEDVIDHSNPSYVYKNQLDKNSQEIKIFKSGERYRFGLQFQHKTGKWSEPFFIQDYTITKYPGTSDNYITTIMPETTLTEEIVNNAINNGYVRVRPMVVYPNVVERKVICQGVVCPTVFNVRDRYLNVPFAQSSWFVRPFSINEYDKVYSELPKETTNDYEEANNLKRPFEETDSTGNFDSFHNNKLVVFRHNTSIPSSDNGRNAEIQSNYQPVSSPFLRYDGDVDKWESNVKDFVDTYSNDFFVDQSIVTLRSPDIEYDTDVQNLDLSNAKFRIVGRVKMSYTFSDLDLDTSTVPNFYNSTSTLAKGFYKNIDNKGIPGSTFCSAPMWLDQPTNIEEDAQTDRAALSSFIIYPFQKSGSLNNQPGPDEQGYQTSKLKYKKLFNLKYSGTTSYNDNIWIPENGSNQVLWNSDANTIVKIPNTNMIYKGVVDTAIINNRNYTYSIVWKGDKGKIGPNYIKQKYWKTYNYSGYPIITTGKRLFSKDQTQNADGQVESDNIINITTDKELIKSFWKGDYKLFYKLYLKLAEIGSGEKDNAVGIYGEKKGDAIHSIETNWEGFDFNRDSYFADSPIRMKYKSTPHIVISLNNSSDGSIPIVLPYAITSDGYNLNKVRSYPSVATYGSSIYVNEYENTREGRIVHFWNKELTSQYGDQDFIRIPDIVESSGLPHPPAFLWLGELYRETDDNTMFGGTTQDAIMNNDWHIAGKTESLHKDIGVKLFWLEGDTYYQRYDHLNTYPFSLEEENGITDIVSFMCETRVNIDGRTDRNRSQETNHALTPNNYNLFNSVYNQKDNFFTYRILDEDKFDLSVFPNTITWTKTKIFGEFVDTWTNITMVSTLDLEGNYGPIRALKTFNNEIISFQDTGVANILFNSRSQIATTEGVPIELANTGKVDGKRYLSDNIGCVNKWSITNTPNGLYFIDNINRAIMKFNGQFDNLSDRLGFRQWAKLEFNDLKHWHPKRGMVYSTHYDRITNDVLFISDINCLGFSEPLGQFSSFYSYEKVPFVANLEDRTVMIKDNKLWLHQEGEYNNFFGKYKDFYTTIVCNPNRELDKVFNNVEFRADSFTRMGIHQPEDTFDLLTVWNEYQTGYQTLKFERNKPSTLKKKFRIWRADIPRNQGTRDRIRNPWAYIKLSKHPKDSNQTVLHDIVVYYTE